MFEVLSQEDVRFYLRRDKNPEKIYLRLVWMGNRKLKKKTQDGWPDDSQNMSEMKGKITNK